MMSQNLQIRMIKPDVYFLIALANLYQDMKRSSSYVTNVYTFPLVRLNDTFSVRWCCWLLLVVARKTALEKFAHVAFEICAHREIEKQIDEESAEDERGIFSARLLEFVFVL